jgi:hypothetical protein
MGIFQYNNVLHSTQREAQHEDRGENNSTQDGEGEKRTTPTSQTHVPGSTNILDVPTESYIYHLVFKMEKPSQMYSKDNISRAI